MKKVLGLLFSIMIFSSELCAEIPSPEDIASRTDQVEVSDLLTLFHSEIALLQDIGFTVEDVDLSLGFVKAAKRAPYEMSFAEGANIFGATPIYQIISVSITAKQISDDFYELKSNFAYELWGIGGGLGAMHLVLMKENSVTDPDIYQSFYAKLRSAIVLEHLSR